jgi:hypothetical protein
MTTVTRTVEKRRAHRSGVSVRQRPAAVVLAAVMLFISGCAGPTRLELAPGDPEGKKLATLVDSEPARRLLVDLLARRTPDPRLAALAPQVLGADLIIAQDASSGPSRLPTQTELHELGLKVSVDFAALAFARALGADDRSRALQAAFDQAFRDGADHSADALRRPGAFPYTVLFAPAWLYRTYPEDGANFDRQRQLLDRLGIANRVIASGETASVEDNAAIIAAAVREASRDGAHLIVVSTSKSGAEVGLALSRLLAPEETASVVAWLNAGGALRGTPLADSAVRPPNSWVTRGIFWVTGWAWGGLTSMMTEPSRQRLQGARLPESIAVVNLVAVPVSGSVGRKLSWTYRSLHSHGPNDGVVLLADSVWPGGANLVALGADHFLAALQQDVYGLALMRALDLAVRLNDARVGQAGGPGNTLPDE